MMMMMLWMLFQRMLLLLLLLELLSWPIRRRRGRCDPAAHVAVSREESESPRGDLIKKLFCPCLLACSLLAMELGFEREMRGYRLRRSLGMRKRGRRAEVEASLRRVHSTKGELSATRRRGTSVSSEPQSFLHTRCLKSPNERLNSSASGGECKLVQQGSGQCSGNERGSSAALSLAIESVQHWIDRPFRCDAS